MNEITTTNYAHELTTTTPLPIDRCPALVYLAALADTGRRSQKQALEVIANMLTGSPDIMSCNWAALRFQHCTAIRSRLVDAYKPSTVNRMLCALRGTLKAAWQLNQLPGEDYHKAVDIKGVTVDTLPAGRDLAGGEILGLMHACESDPHVEAGVRDAALIALLYTGGLRREEVITLDLVDYDQEAGKLVIRGKRNKERNCYISGGAANALDDWMHVRGSWAGPLFTRVYKGGRIGHERMSSQAIYLMLQTRGREAGINKSFSPHDFRRSFVSDLLDAGADISTIAKMAGHASVTTTARYDRRPEEAKRKASKLLHVPYRGRA